MNNVGSERGLIAPRRVVPFISSSVCQSLVFLDKHTKPVRETRHHYAPGASSSLSLALRRLPAGTALRAGLAGNNFFTGMAETMCLLMESRRAGNKSHLSVCVKTGPNTLSGEAELDLTRAAALGSHDHW